MSNDVNRNLGRNLADDGDTPYEVGYRKPPLHTQWPPGRSGNPGGRANGNLNLKTISNDLAEELAELVSVSGPDGKRKVSKQRAYFKKLINDALTGNARDKKILLDAMLRLADLFSPVERAPVGEPIPGAADALERHLQRAIRRKRLEDDASSEDASDGEDVQ